MIWPKSVISCNKQIPWVTMDFHMGSIAAFGLNGAGKQIYIANGSALFDADISVKMCNLNYS